MLWVHTSAPINIDQIVELLFVPNKFKIYYTSTVIKDTRVSITPCTWTIALQARSPSELNEYKHSNVCINNIMSCKDNMLQILSYT